MDADSPSHRIIKKVSRGREFEDLAANYCKAKGYRILLRNYRHGRLEADIVARVGQSLIVVEVRGRTLASFRASKTLHPGKRRRLGALAQILARKYRSPKIRLELLEIIPVRPTALSESLATDLAAHVFRTYRLY
jgi:putative endonuclease